MDDRDRYWTRNPNHPIPEDGSASDYLGIPYDAEFEAWYESDFKGRGWVLPFMKYEGPGNPTNAGAPVSYGDYLSKVHDLRYAYASFLKVKNRITKQQFHDRITYADEQFKKEQSNFTAPGILGQVGIGLKNFAEYAWEKLGGDQHIYPGEPEPMDFETGDEENVDIVPLENNPPAPPNRKEELMKQFNWSSEHYDLLEQYWRSHDQNREYLKNWSADAYNAFKEFDEKHGKIEQNNQNVTRSGNNEFNANVFGVSKQGIPKSSAQWQHGIHTTAGTLYRNDSEAKAKYIREQHEKIYQSLGNDYWKHFKPGAKQFNLHSVRDEIEKNKTEQNQPTEVQGEKNNDQVNQGASTSGIQENNSAIEITQQDTNMSKRPVTENSREQATAASATVSGGTGISPQASQIYIAKGFRMLGNKIRYGNSFRMRSWGNALFNTAGATTSTSIAPSTSVLPYVSLPTEFLAFYIPEGLFNSLQTLPQCRPTMVAVKVTPIGQMVSFSTNSATTQSGTTAHTLYGAGVVGLAQKLPMDRVTITRNATRPMEISSTANFTQMTEWIERIWGRRLPSGNTAILPAVIDSIARAGTSQQIITPNTYGRVYFPTAPRNANTQISTDVSTANSYFSLNRYIPVQPMQPHTGVPIVNMIYPDKPTNWKWPYIGGTAPQLYTTGPKAQSIPATRTGKRRRMALDAPTTTTGSATFSINGTNDTGNQDYRLWSNTSSYATYRLNNIPEFNQMACEKDFVGPVVPSVHVGIEAVQSNVPEAATIDYVNASCDFYVETEIEFEFNAEHDFNFETFNYLMDTYRGDRPTGTTSAVPADFNNVYRRGMHLFS